MSVAEFNPQEVSIAQFLQAIYQDLEGFCYIATRVPDSPKGEGWGRHFFTWPQDKYQISAFIQAETLTNEVYFAPALFNQPSNKKEHFRGSKVVWCEFDGTLPESLETIPTPTIRVQSSDKGHEHWYWVLDSPCDRESLEKINRSLTYTLGADYSGWDAGQVLRPINTVNHKRARNVTLIGVSSTIYNPSVFDGLYIPPPPIASTTELGIIPDITALLSLKPLPLNVMNLFKKGVEVGSRSEGLMALGYGCAESGYERGEIYSVIFDADSRWGKFSNRSDREQRLLEIVSIAKTKYPVAIGTNVSQFKVFGFADFLEIEDHLEWTVENTLHKQGYLLIAGPPGVGKSRFALSLGQSICLEESFIGRSVSPGLNLRVGFISLEMNLVELKYFVEKQKQKWNPDQLKLLQDKFKLIPVGEPVYLNRQEEKVRIENLIRDEGLDGIFIDSMGSSTEQSLTDERDVKNVMDWNDHLRNTYGIFTCWIHHPRKATADNRRPNKLGDVYGSQYITARASGVIYLWPLIDSIECLTLKMRSAPPIPPIRLVNTPTLHFDTHLSSTDKIAASIIASAQGQATPELSQFKLDLEKMMGYDATNKGKQSKPGPETFGV